MLATKISSMLFEWGTDDTNEILRNAFSSDMESSSQKELEEFVNGEDNIAAAEVIEENIQLDEESLIERIEKFESRFADGI